MAGIGLYGVYYSKGVITDGVLTGYTGANQMGKAISATFEPTETDDNPLYANNGIAERDASASSGGTLSLTLDRLSEDAYADLFGLTKTTVNVPLTPGGQAGVTGSGFDYAGDELSAPVGVAFIRWAQEDNNREHHQAVIFSYVTFTAPSDEYQTKGESVEWQTPEIEGTVSGSAVTGAKPWKRVFDFTTQEAAIAFIEQYFAA